jgi:hypothetical protein
MAHMPDRPALAAPMLEQPRDIHLGLRIVSLSPTGMIDRLLQID